VAKRIFITATNTGIGKTYTTVKLLHAFAQTGRRVGVVKPIETGVEDAPIDGQLLLQALKQTNPEADRLDIRDIVPIQMTLPAAPFVAAHGNAIDWKAIDRAVAAMEAICDICLIEGAGGLLVPVDAQTDMIDMVSRFDAKALLVSHCRLGGINDLRLSLEALRNRNIPHEWILNCHAADDGFAQISQPYFDSAMPGWLMLERDIGELCKRLLL